MANIALPTLQKSLGFNSGTLQWVLTAYSLSVCSVTLVRFPEDIDTDIPHAVWWLPHGWWSAGGHIRSEINANCRNFAIQYFDLGVCAREQRHWSGCRKSLPRLTRNLGLGAAFTIPAAQSLVALSFDDERARIRAFAVWGACGSTGFV
nr:hypothetical protein CFP56_07862 [Quercus suber]